MAIQDDVQAFIWGQGGQKRTPEQVARDREIAKALALSAGSTAPIGHWTQGAARMVDALNSRLTEDRASQAEAAGRAAYQAQLDALLGGAPVDTGAQMSSSAPVEQAQQVAMLAPQQASVGSAPAYATDAAPIPPANIGSTEAAPDNAWLRYANQGATRSQPLSPALSKALSFLPELGVTAEVFSGGQPEKGAWPTNVNRVGSTRHDNGNAADVFFYKDGRRLDWSNPQDIPLYQQIVQKGKGAGLTGFGAGEGYMRPGSMHIGFGEPGVWGAGGRSANAPSWLVSAYEGAPVAVAQAPTSAANAAAMMAGAQPQAKPMAYAAPDGVQVASADPMLDVAMALAQPKAKPATPTEQARPREKPMMVDGVPVDRAMLNASPREKPFDLILDPMITPGMLDARPQAKPVIDDAMRNAVPQPKPRAYGDVNAAYQPQQGEMPILPPAPPRQDDTVNSVAASLAAQPQAMPATQPLEAMPPAPQQQRAPSPQQYAQSYTQPQARPQGQGRMNQLMRLAADPWATDGQRAVVSAMMQQEMQAQDPMRALQLEKARLELDQARNPRPIEVGGVLLDPRTYQPIFDSRQAKVPDSVLALDERARRAGLQPGTAEYRDFMIGGGAKNPNEETFFGNPMAITGPDGKVSYGQLGNRGTFRPVQIPEGASFAPPTKQIDTGTEVVTVDQTGNVIARTPKDLAGAEREKVTGKAVGEAMSSLPSDLARADMTVQQIDQLLASEGLSSIVGPLDQYRPSWTLGDSGRDALARLEQLKGGAFLQAFGMLKGGGQITEVEGAKAEKAVARMDRAQSEKEFRTALQDFREAVTSGMGKLRQKAGLPVPAMTQGAVPTNIPGVTIKRLD